MACRTIDWQLRNSTRPSEWILQTVLLAYNDYLFTGDATLISKFTDELYAHTLLSSVSPKTRLVFTTLTEQTLDLLKSINRTDIIRDIVEWPHSGANPNQYPRGREDDNYDYTDYNTVVNACSILLTNDNRDCIIL